MTKDQAIRKVQLLFAKADPKSNNFEQEAFQALQIAKKIMAKNGLEMSDIPADSEKKESFEFDEGTAFIGRVAPWEKNLTMVIELLCQVRALYNKSRISQKTKIRFIGTKTEISVAIELFKIIRKSVNYRSREAYPVPLYGHKINISYKEGFVVRLYERAKETVKMDSPAEQEKYAVMVISKDDALSTWIDDEYSPKEDKVRKRPALNDNAFYRGYVDAENESLHAKKSINHVRGNV